MTFATDWIALDAREAPALTRRASEGGQIPAASWFMTSRCGVKGAEVRGSESCQRGLLPNGTPIAWHSLMAYNETKVY